MGKNEQNKFWLIWLSAVLFIVDGNYFRLFGLTTLGAGMLITLIIFNMIGDDE